MTPKTLFIGAEAVISQNGNEIIKQRVKKSYRIPEIDEKIRKLRTRSEAKLIEKATKVIPVPKILKINEEKKEIVMELIEGKKLSDNLENFSPKKQKEILKQIGENISELHNENIIHGDLTTSNMIVVENDDKRYMEINNKLKNSNSSFALTASKVDGVGERFDFSYSKIDNKVGARVGRGVGGGTKLKIYFIDFGLGFVSNKEEDKAVDLHLLKQALDSKHFKNSEIVFNEILKAYKISKHSDKVLERFRKVEKRGRYKEQY